MGLFKKRATDPDEIATLRSEIATMAARLEAADARLKAADRRLADTTHRLDSVDSEKVALGEQVRGLVRRLDTPLTPPPDVPPPVASTTEAAIDPAALDEVRDRLAALAARLDGVDARVTSIATELANQIDELSGELETLGQASGGEHVGEAVVDELRDAQVRLANEQARYQIAFRQDLAELATRLHKP